MQPKLIIEYDKVVCPVVIGYGWYFSTFYVRNAWAWFYTKYNLIDGKFHGTNSEQIYHPSHFCFISDFNQIPLNDRYKFTFIRSFL